MAIMRMIVSVLSSLLEFFHSSSFFSLFVFISGIQGSMAFFLRWMAVMESRMLNAVRLVSIGVSFMPHGV